MIRTLAHVTTALATSAVAVGLWAAPLGLPAPLAQAAPQAPAAASAAPGPAAPQAPAQAPAATGAVNLNTAADAELDTLPETGKARIKHITDARPIKSIDDLAGPGMPASYVAMLKARATV